MKKMHYSSAIIGLVLLAAAVSAEFGYYIPKAFYKIDENGYKSPLTYIDNLPPTFHRTRRAAQLGGVNFGFPIQFPSFPQIPSGSFQGVQTTITSGGPGGNGGNLDNRFDEGGQTVQTTFTSFNNDKGHFSQTTHFFDKDGKVTTHRHESGPGSQSGNPQSDSSAPPSSTSSASPTTSSSLPTQKKN
ncbi:uncharacterized protein LOC134225953 [Armigeres subalbatus]|uniref:uncharacterized protein LOC134225953 n=1 Tax=Armigeres subalbatus TaxID=124917 RepID=UPI002ED3D9FF